METPTRLGPIRLRPHHVNKIVKFHLSPGLFELSDEQYVKQMQREVEEVGYDRNFYPSIWHRYIRMAMKVLLDNTDKKFELVSGLDGICDACIARHDCSNPEHPYFQIANKADSSAMFDMPELKIGQHYTANDILNLYRQKGWLPEE